VLVKLNNLIVNTTTTRGVDGWGCWMEVSGMLGWKNDRRLTWHLRGERKWKKQIVSKVEW